MVNGGLDGTPLLQMWYIISEPNRIGGNSMSFVVCDKLQKHKLKTHRAKCWWWWWWNNQNTDLASHAMPLFPLGAMLWVSLFIIKSLPLPHKWCPMYSYRRCDVFASGSERSQWDSEVLAAFIWRRPTNELHYNDHKVGRRIALTISCSGGFTAKITKAKKREMTRVVSVLTSPIGVQYLALALNECISKCWCE